MCNMSRRTVKPKREFLFFTFGSIAAIRVTIFFGLSLVSDVKSHLKEVFEEV